MVVLLGQNPIGCFCSSIRPAGILYINTIGLLPPYRNSGIGSFVLDFFLALSRALPAVESIALHVHTENRGALRFYQFRGFELKERCPGYYRRIEPPDAFYLVKGALQTST